MDMEGSFLFVELRGLGPSAKAKKPCKAFEAILGPGPVRAGPRARAKGPEGRAVSGDLGSHPLVLLLGRAL